MRQNFETDKTLISLDLILFIISSITSLIYLFSKVDILEFPYPWKILAILSFLPIAFVGFYLLRAVVAIVMIKLTNNFYMDNSCIKECVGNLVVTKYKFRKIKNAELYRFDATDGSAYILKIYSKYNPSIKSLNKFEMIILDPKKEDILSFLDEFWKRSGIKLEEKVIKSSQEYLEITSK